MYVAALHKAKQRARAATCLAAGAQAPHTPCAFRLAEATVEAAKATADFVEDVGEAVADKAVAAAKATAEVVEAVAGGRAYLCVARMAPGALRQQLLRLLRRRRRHECLTCTHTQCGCLVGVQHPKVGVADSHICPFNADGWESHNGLLCGRLGGLVLAQRTERILLLHYMAARLCVCGGPARRWL